MGLACSQARLLTLTARKADCEYGISIDSIHKMALSREMSELSSEYSSRLKAKQVCYYANGKYNQINANYLMGYGSNTEPILNGTMPLKTDNSMILADFNGRTILNKEYANAIMSVCGNNIMDANGKGSTFSLNEIPKILETLTSGAYKAEDFENVINNRQVNGGYNGSVVNTNTLEDTGKTQYIDNSSTITSKVQKLVDFYLPIFSSAATNGWTTEYNNEIALNDDYVSDAISSGYFQIVGVDGYGNFDSDKNITYYLTAGKIETKSDADTREDITAWYNAEKARITEKENYIDIHMNDLSTELEAIKTEMESIQSLIDDAISSVFDWGGG